MTSLTRFENNGLELVIDTQTGEAFATISGYASMVGKAKSTISERATVRKEDTKMSEILTSTGLKTVRLIPAETVYDWAFDDKPELARAMGKAGATVYIHRLAGYKITSSAIEKVEPTPPKKELPPPDVRVANFYEALKGFGFQLDNPRFAQSFQDVVGDIVGLTPNESKDIVKDVWCGVAERAEQLGYGVGDVAAHRISLGLYMGKKGLKMTKEKRLCGGTQRPINIYLVCDELDKAIVEFFDKKLG
jgi:hypothetical protein